MVLSKRQRGSGCLFLYKYPLLHYSGGPGGLCLALLEFPMGTAPCPPGLLQVIQDSAPAPIPLSLSVLLPKSPNVPGPGRALPAREMPILGCFLGDKPPISSL